MSGQKKHTRPMMYIQQPAFGAVNNKMQHVFTAGIGSERKEKLNSEEAKTNKAKQIPSEVQEVDVTIKKVKQRESRRTKTEEVERKQQKMQSGDEQGLTEKGKASAAKSFRDLEVKEKIKHLLNLPFGIPPIKCDIFTENKKYRGIITNQKDDEVVIRNFGTPRTVHLKTDEIVEIVMKSF